MHYAIPIKRNIKGIQCLTNTAAAIFSSRHLFFYTVFLVILQWIRVVFFSLSLHLENWFLLVESLWLIKSNYKSQRLFCIWSIECAVNLNSKIIENFWEFTVYCIFISRCAMQGNQTKQTRKKLTTTAKSGCVWFNEGKKSRKKRQNVKLKLLHVFVVCSNLNAPSLQFKLRKLLCALFIPLVFGVCVFLVFRPLNCSMGDFLFFIFSWYFLLVFHIVWILCVLCPFYLYLYPSLLYESESHTYINNNSKKRNQFGLEKSDWLTKTTTTIDNFTIQK